MDAASRDAPGIARDRRLMGEYVAGRAVTSVYYVVIAAIIVCMSAMFALQFLH
ncbi:hypothetical protein [Propioniciclava tarda]|uniref:hypothetical protein n=1 Tax=Propioniciclava tarda TaxID=433330 RepID=UPI0011754DB8|nr:hypothetical protein [Propioniciclava tarda]SMO83096.1 hypothetical protein SAMN06266982_12326 [Propioniciclava tarda]